MTRAAVDRGLGRLTAAAMADAAGSPSGPDGDGADGGMPVDTMAWSQEILFESLGGYAFGEDWRLYADDAPPQGATISAKAASTAAAETADAGSTVAAEAADATAPPSTHRPLFEAMYAITQGLPRRISRPWRLWWSLPTAENRRVWAAQATIRAEFERILARRRAARVAARAAGAPPLPPVPLLDVLLDAGGDTGDAPPPVDPISEADIMDNAVTIAFAGTDTTAATLAFVFYHLATHPKVQADLVAEIETVTAADGRGDGDSDTGSTNPRGAAAARGGRRHPRKQLNATELEALPLLSAVVSESSRLLPTSFAIPRTPRKQFTHGDMVIPAGTLVIINVLRMGQDEGLWPPPSPGVTPADFCVERWLGPDGGGGEAHRLRTPAVWGRRPQLPRAARGAVASQGHCRAGARGGVGAAPGAGAGAQARHPHGARARGGGVAQLSAATGVKRASRTQEGALTGDLPVAGAGVFRVPRVHAVERADLHAICRPSPFTVPLNNRSTVVPVYPTRESKADDKHGCRWVWE